MIVYGKQIVLYVLDKFPEMIKEVYLQKEIDKKLFHRFSKLDKKIARVDSKKAQAMAKGGNHQGFLLLVKDVVFTPFDELKAGKFLVVLYGITDVGNIGAIVRSAYVFGADGVIITGLKHLALEPLIRSSAGALLSMPLALYSKTLDLINELKMSGFKTYGAGFGGENVKDVKFGEKKALFLGSEGDGIPQKILSRLDKIISIKMAREFDSLNVSAAAAVLCDRIANG